MRRKANHSFWLCATVCLMAFVHSFALASEAEGRKGTRKKAEGATFQASKKDPILITSNRMEVDRKKSTITYKGQVVAIQGEMTIRSEALTAYYSPDMKGVKEVIAEGNVRVTQGDRIATGTKAIFDGSNQTITLTGNPVIRQGNNQVSGPRIIFFIEEDRAVAEGGRVQTTIFPDEIERQEKREAGSGKER